jgi:hypothetical protein
MLPELWHDYKQARTLSEAMSKICGSCVSHSPAHLRRRQLVYKGHGITICCCGLLVGTEVLYDTLPHPNHMAEFVIVRFQVIILICQHSVHNSVVRLIGQAFPQNSGINKVP